MTLHVGFFNSVDQDRLYMAEDMTRPYEGIISNGVFATPSGTPSNYLQVLASEGMDIIVKPGRGLFANKWLVNDSNMTLTIGTSEVVLNRIDSIVVRIDTSEAVRNGFIMVKPGTPATYPDAPNMENTETVTEYRLADIYVPAQAQAIVQSDITDQRGSADCPWVTSLIYQMDTSTLFLQWQEAYQNFYDNANTTFEQFMDSVDTEFHNWKDGADNEFRTWFNERDEEFTTWFQNLHETVATQTLIRTFTSYYVTTAQDESVIPININQYNNELDILQVHINGLMLVPEVDYTIASNPTSQITLTKSVDSGTAISFTVYKSVDGSEAESVVSDVFELQNEMLEARADIEAIGVKVDNAEPVPLYKHDIGVFPNNGVEIIPSKPLAQCMHGWELIFTRFNLDTSQGADSYVQTFRIPKRSYKAADWNGETVAFPMVWTFNNNTGNVEMTVKSFTVYPDKIVGTTFNEADSSKNMVLRAIYEY